MRIVNTLDRIVNGGCIASVLVSAMLLAVAAAQAAPTETFLDTASAGYSDTPTGAGAWQNASLSTDLVTPNGRVNVNNGITATATWTIPGTITAGTYSVQVEYLVHPTEATNATWSVNGNTVATVNETEFANQATSPTAPPTESGWYTLPGTYALTPGSTISVTNPTNGSTGTGTLDVNAIRLAKSTDVIVDELAAVTGATGSWSTTSNSYTTGSSPYPQSLRFAISPNGSGVLTYSLASSGVTSGTSDLYLSWGTGITANNNHTTDARYVLDLDGNFATTGDQFTFDANENLLGDGSSNTLAREAWSGWVYMGNFAITANSKVEVFNNAGGTPVLTSDALRVVQLPEPASMALLAAGAVVLVRRRRR